MNTTFFKEKIDQFGGAEKLAIELGLTKQAIYGWLKGTKPEEKHFHLAIELLDLSISEIDLLMGVPETKVFFRTKGLKNASDQVKYKSKDLAETIFKLDGNSFAHETLFRSAVADQESAISYIRTALNVSVHEPVVFSKLLIELKKRNVNILFIPFSVMGIADAVEENQVAFTARKANRVNIFVDTRRTRDEITFDVCHELAHLVLDHQDPTEADEKICNDIAGELVYPKAFFAINYEKFDVFCDVDGHSAEQIVDSFFKLNSDYDWNALGLAYGLKRAGRISMKKTNDTYSVLRHIHERLLRRNKSKSMEALYFSNLDADDYDKLKEFFSSDIYRDKDLFKPILEIVEAAAIGRISSRRFSEIFGLDSGDADELVKGWRAEYADLSQRS